MFQSTVHPHFQTPVRLVLVSLPTVRITGANRSVDFLVSRPLWAPMEPNSPGEGSPMVQGQRRPVTGAAAPRRCFLTDLAGGITKAPVANR